MAARRYYSDESKLQNILNKASDKAEHGTEAKLNMEKPAQPNQASTGGAGAAGGSEPHETPSTKQSDSQMLQVRRAPLNSVSGSPRCRLCSIGSLRC